MPSSDKSNPEEIRSINNHGHGGQLKKAILEYDIPLNEWIDLSTGINPTAYPLQNVPKECWQRLPETNDGLETAAKDYYGSEYLLPVSGSQEAIQKLPLLFSKPLTVGIVTPAYHSHQQAWENAGHKVVLIPSDDIQNSLFSLDVLLIVNPTNPSCHHYKREKLLKWHQTLASQNSLLIIDEAFIDCTPEQSLISETPLSGLIVLRSIGKFFGLAGVRLGFVWAEADILSTLSKLQDDWSVSHPARWAGRLALEDKTWQEQQRGLLKPLSERLNKLLDQFLIKYNIEKEHKSGGVSLDSSSEVSILYPVGNTCLFAYFEHEDSCLIHEKLAKQGILCRLFIENNNQNNALRFGLPANEDEWQRLQHALDLIIEESILGD